MHSKHIFIINAYSQKIQDFPLENLDDYSVQFLDGARKAIKPSIDIEEDKLFCYVPQKGLGIFYEDMFIEGGLFILASDEKLQDCNMTHIPLFNKIKYHLDPSYILKEMIKKEGYGINDSIRVPFSSKTITFHELIERCKNTSFKKKKEVFNLAYLATADFTDWDKQPSIKDIVKKVC